MANEFHSKIAIVSKEVDKYLLNNKELIVNLWM